MKEKKNIKWYDNENVITNLILGTILIMVISSQSFATRELSIEFFSSVINHNSVFLLAFIYFILIKTPIGKKYFNYLNVFLIFVYFITMIGSFLTTIQSFTLSTVLTFTIYFILVICLIHTLFVDTRIWKEFHLSKSPFNELTNDWLFGCIVILSVVLLAVNLISIEMIRGMVLSLLTMIYTILLARYIYLYRNYLENKGKENRLFDSIHNVKKDFPKIHAVRDEVSQYTLNFYQVFAIGFFIVCFFLGIVFGNLFATCEVASYFSSEACLVTQFNFSLMIVIWFIGLLISIFLFSIGHQIALLREISQKLNKNHIK